MTTTDILSKVFGITHDDAVTAIVATYRRADDDQTARGATWYEEAHALARALDPSNIRRAAGVIAALSPQMPWTRNVTLAVRAYADGIASGAPFATMATRILRGEDLADVLNGPKTRAFAETIADPAHADTVVVDRHALSVILSRNSTDKDANALGRKGAYAACAAAYVAAADVLGVSATVVQATTWVVWRESEIRTAAAARRERSGERVSA
jgi:hypothetical protein